MPKHRNRRIVYRALAVVAAGLIMIVSACADDPEPDTSWTQVNFWIQDQKANSQHFGRELTVSIGWGIGSEFDHPLIFAFVPEDETERWPEKPGSGLSDSDSDNLVRDLEFANDMCVEELVLVDCSLVSLSYRLCQSQACEHHTITELTGIVADNGVVSDITLHWVDPESRGNYGPKVIYITLLLVILPFALYLMALMILFWWLTLTLTITTWSLIWLYRRRRATTPNTN